MFYEAVQVKHAAKILTITFASFIMPNPYKALKPDTDTRREINVSARRIFERLAQWANARPPLHMTVHCAGRLFLPTGIA